MSALSEKSPFAKQELIPQEETLEIQRKKGKLLIGIPKESRFNERRICLTPDAVNVLTARGHKIVIESEAGYGANFTDSEYSEAGALITEDKKEVFECSMILKINPPTVDEINLMKADAILISALQLNTQDKEYFKALTKKRITAVAIDYLRDNHGFVPVLTTLSEIAGTTSVLIAGEIMSNVNQGNGLMFGGVTGVTPTEVVIIGAGVVGEYAAKAAIGLGASVKIFDNSISSLRKIQNNIGQRIYTSTLHPKVLKKALMRCDVLIAAVRSQGISPVIVSEEMVMAMKDGAVIIDVSIDSGGIVETSELTTHEDPVRVKHGVLHYGVPNIPSRVSRTASMTISNYFTPYLLDMNERGGLENLIASDIGLQAGIYMYKGVLTSASVGERFDLTHKDINLLLF